MGDALRHRLRGLPLLLGAAPSTDVFWDLVGAPAMISRASATVTGVPSDVADDVGLTAGHHRKSPRRESRSDDAECFGVVCAPLDHLSPIHRRELRIDLAGGVRRLHELVAQPSRSGLCHRLAFAVTHPGLRCLGCQPGERLERIARWGTGPDGPSPRR